jgi:hypothetical protein
MFGHDPPTYLRSIAATRCPCLAKVHAAIVDPVPPPRITRSYSSGSMFLDNWAEETFSTAVKMCSIIPWYGMTEPENLGSQRARQISRYRGDFHRAAHPDCRSETTYLHRVLLLSGCGVAPESFHAAGGLLGLCTRAHAARIWARVLANLEPTRLRFKYRAKPASGTRDAVIRLIKNPFSRRTSMFETVRKSGVIRLPTHSRMRTTTAMPVSGGSLKGPFAFFASA